jgi:ATP-dependent RNA helicase DDX46/PRP5
MGNVRVKGKDCPAPVKNWAQCGFSSKIMRVIENNNYDKPMPIQAQAIPCILSGRDVIGIAKTGSGKTLAFVLPLIRHVKDQPDIQDGDGPIGLIMAPTRELSVQIFQECRKFARRENLTPVCVYGGTGISDQIAELKKGAHIIVCTPGRMIDMLCANNGRVTNLRRVTFVVLDEADRMFDMGFEPQVMMILNSTRENKQTVLFSATFPRAMEALARKVLKDPIEITVGGRSIVGKDIAQHVIVLDEEQKFNKLLELLGHFITEGLVLIFVDRHEAADALLKNLIKCGYPCMTLHGGMDQDDRDSVLSDFKNKIVSVLVATSVAARGLDVKELKLVVNYDVPNHYEDYVHRCGRTGRAGKKGTAVTLITPEQERYAGDIIKALESSFAAVPDELKKLWESFKEKKKSGLVKDYKSGFGGHGFKFDSEEKEKNKQEKELQKAISGLVDTDEEEEEEDDLDKLIMSKMRKKTGLSGSSEIDKLTMSSTKFEDVIGRPEGGTNVVHDSVVSIFGGQAKNQKIAEAFARAQAINKSKNFGSAKPLFGGQQHFFDTNHYDEELEINDFPQNVRWKVTQKEAVESITEETGAAVTVRGTYVPPNKETPEGEKKTFSLY